MPIILQYHEIRGLAAPIRMMFEYAGVRYENKFADNWFNVDKPKVKELNALANLPTLFDEDGTIVTQSCAVFHYVGEKLRLNGSSDAERSRVDQIVCQVQDWRNAVAKMAYSKRTADTVDKFLERIVSHYKKLEGVFQRSGYIYSAANRPTTGDFHLFEMLDQNEQLTRATGYDSLVTQYPLLYSFYTRFLSLPTLQAYFDGPLYKLPINNPTYAWFAGDEYPLKPVEGEVPDDQITVGYWKIRGLAAPLRMMCVFAGANFKSVEHEGSHSKSEGFDYSAWHTKAKPALVEKNRLMNLP